mmetsp:Transcript_13083/g.22071  ORF Transcript_13083/g.22071 Transcript_13083/m.22071 type:complete len:113 (+) Transcript_13083:998-1336(+)
MQERGKALKALKQVRANGDISQEENKIIEQILKGINILMLKSKSDIRMGSQQGAELRSLIDEETNTLFKLTHHNVFRIQIQVFKLLFQLAKVSQSLSLGLVQTKKDKEDEEP